MATSEAVLHKPRPWRAPYGVPVSLYANERLLLVLGVDLSPGGIFLDTRVRLAIGARVQMELGIGDERFLLDAEVVRVEAGHGMGLRFHDLARDARLAIIEFIARQREEMEAAEYRRQAGESGAGSSAARHARTARQLAQQRIRHQQSRSRSGRRAPRLALALLATTAAAAALGLSSGRLTKASPQPEVAGDRAVVAAGIQNRLAEGAAAAAAATRASALERHLSEGARRLAQGDLSVPRDDSALDHFRTALALEPGHRAALSGVAAVCDAYIERASGRAMAGDRSGAQWRYQRALEILAGDPAAHDLPDRLAREQAVRAALARLDRPERSAPATRPARKAAATGRSSSGARRRR